MGKRGRCAEVTGQVKRAQPVVKCKVGPAESPVRIPGVGNCTAKPKPAAKPASSPETTSRSAAASSFVRPPPSAVQDVNAVMKEVAEAQGVSVKTLRERYRRTLPSYKDPRTGEGSQRKSKNDRMPEELAQQLDEKELLAL